MWFPPPSTIKTPKHESLARAIEIGIADGTLRAGERLAPQREFAYQLGIAVEVVTRAFKLARSRGLIISKVGCGTFVLNFPEAVLSSDSEPDSLIDLRAKTTTIAHFNDTLNRLLGSISRRKSLHGFFEYHPGGGLEHHRVAGARWIAQRGLQFTADEVIMVDSARDALFMILAGASMGEDLILVENLRFAGFRRLCELFRVRIRGVAMDEFGLCPRNALVRAGAERVAAICCVPTCHDPTNTTMSLERRHQVVALARELDCLIVEDDSAGYLVSDPLPTFSALAPERSVYIIGLNRTLAVGLRVGFIAMRPRVMDRLRSTIDALSWTSPALLGEITASLITNRGGGKLMRWHREDAAMRQMLARKILGLTAAPTFSEMTSNHLWLPLVAPFGAIAVTGSLAARNVAVFPSQEFAVEDGLVPEAIRICLGGVSDLERLETGLRIIANTIAREAMLP